MSSPASNKPAAASAGRAWLRLTREERAQLKRRMGPALFQERLLREDTRELKMGGLFRWCPMRWLNPIARAGLHLTGLWKAGRRNYLDIRVREETFFLPGLPAAFDGFTILHLSDLHFDLDPDFPDALAQTLETIRGRYDVAAFTGDFNNYTVHNSTLAVRLTARLLREHISAPAYGVLGNHDSLRDIPSLEEAGLRILLNESVTLRRGKDTLLLAGIDDPNIFQTHNLRAALSARKPGQPVVLLAHAPSCWREAADQGVDLVLCGHVHGGQICLPNGRTIPWRNWKFPAAVRRGRWCEGATQGYTTYGAGACGIPIRFFCPPEAVLSHLRQGGKAASSAGRAAVAASSAGRRPQAVGGNLPPEIPPTGRRGGTATPPSEWAADASASTLGRSV